VYSGDISKFSFYIIQRVLTYIANTLFVLSIQFIGLTMS